MGLRMPNPDRDREFRDAFPVLFQRSYQTAYRLIGDRSVAEDLAQEALTRAYVHWHRTKPPREGWVVTTTANLVIDRWRKLGRAPQPPRPPSGHLDPDVALRLDLQRLLATLPRRQREVAVLRYLEDRPEAEVAELLGCSVGSVKRHASRAASRLRELLSPATLAPGAADA
jgi:RNA polymerase sigma factor (sigma-70 family)